MMIRSLIFYFFLYLWTLLLGILCLPCLLLPSEYTKKIANIWITGILALLKYICSIDYETQGTENIPNYPVIVASKHQSTFETLFQIFLMVVVIWIFSYIRKQGR